MGPYLVSAFGRNLAEVGVDPHSSDVACRRGYWHDLMCALLLCLPLVASACSVHRYTCDYGGHSYQVGDTWTNGCQSCRCPSEGSKSVWCNPLSCADGSVDGSADADEGG